MTDPDDAGQRSREEIETELSETREHLAETVDALQHRLDVKARLGERAAAVKRDHGRDLAAGAGVLAVVVAVLVVVRRRRR